MSGHLDLGGWLSVFPDFREIRSKQSYSGRTGLREEKWMFLFQPCLEETDLIPYSSLYLLYFHGGACWYSDTQRSPWTVTNDLTFVVVDLEKREKVKLSFR